MKRTQIIQIIAKAENDPAKIFTELSEADIWEHAPTILKDDEHSVFGYLLMQGIEKYFDHLSDKKALIQILLQALSPQIDELIYEIAQRIITANALTWSSASLRQFYRRFEDNYLAARNASSTFIARLSIEARVMLPILRHDERQHQSAIGFLLEEFPAFLEDKDAPAYLVIKALKLLRLSYDLVDGDPEIVHQVRECLTSENLFIKAEASFNIGLVDLHSAFKANNITDFRESLAQASQHFEQSANLQENRVDAILLLQICRCYFLLTDLVSSEPSEVSKAISEARDTLVNRLILIGGLTSTDTSSLEFNLVRMLTYLEQFSQQITSPQQWTDLTPRMSILADLYKAIQVNEVGQGLIRSASHATQQLIVLPEITSKFIQVQEIIAKLERKLDDANWQETAPQHEIEFYEIALKQLRESSPNEIAATRFNQFRVAASLVNARFADLIVRLQDAGYPLDETIFHVFKKQFKEEEEYPLAVAAPSQEICNKIIPNLQKHLRWSANDYKWQALSFTIQLIANYFHHTCIVENTELTRFLYAKTNRINGLGDSARESHLENHFLLKTNGLLKVEHQQTEETPGRPDLFIRWNHGVGFPIEVKVEESNISPESLKEDYLAQPHLYATTTSQVAFLFVLDVILKQKPGKYEADYWYFDSLENTGSGYPIYVIVVIFPANRFRPSDYSWGRTPRP